jgi:hypothetical protein
VENRKPFVPKTMWFRQQESIMIEAHWVNLIDREPPKGKDMQVLVVQTSGPRSSDIGYEDAKLTDSGWVFSGTPQYRHVVAWLESDRRLTRDELSQVPKTAIKF